MVSRSDRVELLKIINELDNLKDLHSSKVSEDDFTRLTSLLMRLVEILSSLDSTIPHKHSFNFQNDFRTSSNALYKLQNRYLPYFRDLRGKILDLGCGRGEFLKLLSSIGKSAYGVDANPEMVRLCTESGHEVYLQDIFDHLEYLEDDSLAGIFSAQLIEHLSSDDLIYLFSLCFRKLSPGGVVVLETLNGSSLYTLVERFFVDITHKNPLNSNAIAAYIKYFGFVNVEIDFSNSFSNEERLIVPDNQHSDADLINLLSDNFTKLNNVLYSDRYFAVIANKP